MERGISGLYQSSIAGVYPRATTVQALFAVE